MPPLRKALLGWGVVLSVLLVGGFWFGSLVRDARRAAQASCAQCPLNQLTLAFHNYHEVYGSFPPAYVADANGRPRHSWRALILPYVDAKDVYQQYDFSEPWDGPNNSRLANRMTTVFHSCTEPESKTFTTFVAITGPGTIFPGAGCTKLSEITDGPQNTILLVEIKDSKIPWLAPIDLSADEAVSAWQNPERSGISCVSWRRPLVVFCDRLTGYSLGRTLPPESLRALTTIQGGETISQYELIEKNQIYRGAKRE